MIYRLCGFLLDSCRSLPHIYCGAGMTKRKKGRNDKEAAMGTREKIASYREFFLSAIG